MSNCDESFLFTSCENKEIWTGQNRSPIFWHMVMIIMEKELKSCLGVLLRTDLTPWPPSHPFLHLGLDDHATYKKIGDLLCLVMFLDLHSVCFTCYSGFIQAWYFWQNLYPYPMIQFVAGFVVDPNFLFKMALNLLCTTPLFLQLFHVCESCLVVPMASFEKKKLLSGLNFFCR